MRNDLLVGFVPKCWKLKCSRSECRVFLRTVLIARLTNAAKPIPDFDFDQEHNVADRNRRICYEENSIRDYREEKHYSVVRIIQADSYF